MLLLTGSLLIALASPLTPTAVPTAKDEAVARALSVFQLWLEDKVRRESVPSVSVAVVYDQELVWAKALGFADLDKRVPATTKTQYRVASVTKTFTATALMQLRDEGKLQLDDPVDKHLAWFMPKAAPGYSCPGEAWPVIRRDRVGGANCFPPGAPVITLRHLLTHGGGLAKDVPGDYWDTMTTFPDGSALPALLASAALTEIAPHTFRFESGETEGDVVRFEVDAKGTVGRLVGLGWSARPSRH